MISLDDNELHTLTTRCNKEQLTKTRLIVKLLTQQPGEQKQQSNFDQQTLIAVLKELQKTTNQLSAIGNNLNQFEHQVNAAMNSGYFDAKAAKDFKSNLYVIAQDELQQKIIATVKKLTRYVDY